MLRNLIETIVKCIHIEPAECLDVALDFNLQSMEIMESKEILEIKSKTKNDDEANKVIKPKYKTNEIDDEFWFCDIKSEV